MKKTAEDVGIKPSDLRTQAITRDVRLSGLVDVMFDRYAGDNNTKLEPWQKLYLDGDRHIIFPSLNILSFLSAHNTNSAPKRLRDKRKFKDLCNACLSFVSITPTMIPFLRNGKPIILGQIKNDKDEQSGVYVHYAVARLDKGIPNPKARPVLPLPWDLEFKLTIASNREVKEQDILNLFEEGGLALGIGTFRGVFGKFKVAAWE